MIYAIGEIILVVIGILIAIQLNSWNQDRIQKKEFNLVLQNLHEEFNRTKELFRLVAISANKQLMELFSAKNDSFSTSRIDTLLYKSFQQAPFFPPQPILNELITSGKIKSLPNDTLKRFLFDWESTINWFHFDYDLLILFSTNQMEPYINKHLSWKNIDIAARSKFFEDKSILKTKSNELFQELEFENLIDSNLFHSDRLHKRLTEINTLIDQILIEIEKSLR